MRDRDGRPAVRDPTFLSETKIMEKHVVDRLVPGADKVGLLVQKWECSAAVQSCGAAWVGRTGFTFHCSRLRSSRPRRRVACLPAGTGVLFCIPLLHLRCCRLWMLGAAQQDSGRMCNVGGLHTVVLLALALTETGNHTVCAACAL